MNVIGCVLGLSDWLNVVVFIVMRELLLFCNNFIVLEDGGFIVLILVSGVGYDVMVMVFFI